MEQNEGKNGKSLPPVVAIDGTKIRSLREAKKLTQLYVASVVGVTTDTISRWENNRYPTIKRENGEKLATALEVPLEDILQPEAQEVPGKEPPAAGSRAFRLLLPVFVAVVVIVAVVLFSRKEPAAPEVERRLPPFAAPGQIIPVQLRINRGDSSSAGLIIKERLPAGWRMVDSLPPASTPRGRSDEVKWLMPGGSGVVVISYTALVAPGAAMKSTAAFDGEIVARDDGKTRTWNSGGDRSTTVAGVHWADRNGDGRIDDDEIMPAYYLTEEMKGLDLDWKSIERIWSSKGYRWDPATRNFEVIR